MTSTYATNQQLATIRARRIDDIARQMMQTGISLTHEQADDIGEEGCDWLRTRLGLRLSTDDSGVHANA